MLGFCIVWYLIGHSMESTIFPLELVHEHRNYFPSFGIILGITYLMSVAFERVEIRHGSSVITVLIILTLSGLTYLRAQQWSDPVTLAITEAEHHPTSYRSVYAAGRVLLRSFYDARRPDLFREIRRAFNHGRGAR